MLGVILRVDDREHQRNLEDDLLADLDVTGALAETPLGRRQFDIDDQLIARVDRLENLGAVDMK